MRPDWVPIPPADTAQDKVAQAATGRAIRDNTDHARVWLVGLKDDRTDLISGEENARNADGILTNDWVEAWSFEIVQPLLGPYPGLSPIFAGSMRGSINKAGVTLEVRWRIGTTVLATDSTAAIGSTAGDFHIPPGILDFAGAWPAGLDGSLVQVAIDGRLVGTLDPPPQRHEGYIRFWNDCLILEW